MLQHIIYINNASRLQIVQMLLIKGSYLPYLTQIRQD